MSPLAPSLPSPSESGCELVVGPAISVNTPENQPGILSRGVRAIPRRLFENLGDPVKCVLFMVCGVGAFDYWP
jgi:hypothetical protein